MKLLVFYTSVLLLLCLAFAKQNRHYEAHNRFKRQTNQNHPRSLENDKMFNIFLHNQRNMPLHINSEQFSEYTGAAQHGGHSIQPLHTDQARHIIHFPQQQAKEDTGKDSFEVTKAQTERHNAQQNELYMNGIKVNASLLNELMNLADLKPTPNKRNSFQIHNIVQPVTKVTRTVYINGVKVENNDNVGSIINALLNQHTSSSSSSPREDSNKELLNVNTNSNYNQQSNQQIPMFILNHLNDNYKPDSTAGQREYLSENSESNHFMQIPDIDIRLGGLEQHGKLARLREKGRNIKNATSIPDKQRRNQHMHVKPRDLTQFVTQDVKHKSVEDGIIFL